MVQIIKEISVEVSKPNLFQAIVAKQYDMNSRFLKVTLVDDGNKIEIPNSGTVAVVINAERPDGQSKGFDGEVNNDGTVTVPLHSWILELNGTVVCDISVIDTASEDNKKLTTTSFTLLVEKAAYGGEDITSDPQYDLLTNLIIQATESAEQAAKSAEEAVSAAESIDRTNIDVREVNGVSQTYISNTENTKQRNTIISDENGNLIIEPLDEHKGIDLDADGNPIKSEINGVNNFVKGRGNTVVMEDESHGGATVMGDKNVVTKPMGATFGYENENHASGAAFVCGNNNVLEEKALGASVSGIGNIVKGQCGNAAGRENTVEGEFGDATGYKNTVGRYGHVEGRENEAGNNTHVEGYKNKATGAWSHVENSENTAAGAYAHAGGKKSNAPLEASFVHGIGLESGNQGQAVVGKYNVVDYDAVFVVGNGTDSKKSNAFTVKEDGRVIVREITESENPVNGHGFPIARYRNPTDGKIPLTPKSPGNMGEFVIGVGKGYLFVCVAKDTWVRVPIDKSQSWDYSE